MKVSIVIYCPIKNQYLIENCVSKIKQHTDINYNIILIKDLISSLMIKQLETSLNNIFICDMRRIRFYIDGDIICCINNNIQATPYWMSRLQRHLGEDADIVSACINDLEKTPQSIKSNIPENSDDNTINSFAEQHYQKNKNVLQITDKIIPFCFITTRNVYQELGLISISQYRQYFKRAIAKEFQIGIAKDVFLWKLFTKGQDIKKDVRQPTQNQHKFGRQRRQKRQKRQKESIGIIILTNNQLDFVINKQINYLKSIVEPKYDVFIKQIDSANDHQNKFNENIIDLVESKCDIIVCTNCSIIQLPSDFFTNHYNEFMKLKWFSCFNNGEFFCVGASKLWMVIGGWNNFIDGKDSFYELDSRMDFYGIKRVKNDKINIKSSYYNNIIDLERRLYYTHIIALTFDINFLAIKLDGLTQQYKQVEKFISNVFFNYGIKYKKIIWINDDISPHTQMFLENMFSDIYIINLKDTNVNYLLFNTGIQKFDETLSFYLVYLYGGIWVDNIDYIKALNPDVMRVYEKGYFIYNTSLNIFGVKHRNSSLISFDNEKEICDNISELVKAKIHEDDKSCYCIDQILDEGYFKSFKNSYYSNKHNTDIGILCFYNENSIHDFRIFSCMMKNVIYSLDYEIIFREFNNNINEVIQDGLGYFYTQTSTMLICYIDQLMSKGLIDYMFNECNQNSSIVFQKVRKCFCNQICSWINITSCDNFKFGIDSWCLGKIDDFFNIDDFETLLTHNCNRLVENSDYIIDDSMLLLEISDFY